MLVSRQTRLASIMELIKILSNAHGGDDPIFLHEVFLEMVDRYKHDLNIPLNCLRDIQLALML